MVRSKSFMGDLNQFEAIANLTLSQHYLEKKKKQKCIYSLQPGNLEAEVNNRTAKRILFVKRCLILFQELVKCTWLFRFDIVYVYFCILTDSCFILWLRMWSFWRLARDHKLYLFTFENEVPLMRKGGISGVAYFISIDEQLNIDVMF